MRRPNSSPPFLLLVAPVALSLATPSVAGAEPAAVPNWMWNGEWELEGLQLTFVNGRAREDVGGGGESLFRVMGASRATLARQGEQVVPHHRVLASSVGARPRIGETAQAFAIFSRGHQPIEVQQFRHHGHFHGVSTGPDDGD